MPKLGPIDWGTFVRILEAEGFRKARRQKGSHIALEKEGIARPCIVPKYGELGVDIIKSNLRTARISRERYFQLLDQCK